MFSRSITLLAIPPFIVVSALLPHAALATNRHKMVSLLLCLRWLYIDASQLFDREWLIECLSCLCSFVMVSCGLLLSFVRLCVWLFSRATNLHINLIVTMGGTIVNWLVGRPSIVNVTNTYVHTYIPFLHDVLTIIYHCNRPCIVCVSLQLHEQKPTNSLQDTLPHRFACSTQYEEDSESSCSIRCICFRLRVWQLQPAVYYFQAIRSTI